MSTWRRIALERLPEYQRTIAESQNIMAMWIDLQFEFERLYEEADKSGSLNDDLVGRFYQYANWCLDTASEEGEATDASTAVCCAFFEHIILKKGIRDDLHRWMTPQQLKELAGCFTYHFPVAEFEKFAAEFQKTQAKTD